MTGETILIVEDEGLIALHLTEMLENAGYRIAGPASSGDSALSVLEKSPPPDLILMDIGLAGSLDGVETAKKIRMRYTIPLIFVTAYTSERALSRMQEVSPDDIVIKPFVENDLLKSIGRLVGRPVS